MVVVVVVVVVGQPSPLTTPALYMGSTFKLLIFRESGLPDPKQINLKSEKVNAESIAVLLPNCHVAPILTHSAETIKSAAIEIRGIPLPYTVNDLERWE